MNEYLIILKPEDITYGKGNKPLPGGMYFAKNGNTAIKKALADFGKPAKVWWHEKVPTLKGGKHENRGR